MWKCSCRKSKGRNEKFSKMKIRITKELGKNRKVKDCHKLQRIKAEALFFTSIIYIILNSFFPFSIISVLPLSSSFGHSIRLRSKRVKRDLALGQCCPVMLLNNWQLKRIGWLLPWLDGRHRRLSFSSTWCIGASFSTSETLLLGQFILLLLSPDPLQFNLLNFSPSELRWIWHWPWDTWPPY